MTKRVCFILSDFYHNKKALNTNKKDNYGKKKHLAGLFLPANISKVKSQSSVFSILSPYGKCLFPIRSMFNKNRF